MIEYYYWGIFFFRLDSRVAMQGLLFTFRPAPSMHSTTYSFSPTHLHTPSHFSSIYVYPREYHIQALVAAAVYVLALLDM